MSTQTSEGDRAQCIRALVSTSWLASSAVSAVPVDSMMRVDASYPLAWEPKLNDTVPLVSSSNSLASLAEIDWLYASLSGLLLLLLIVVVVAGRFYRMNRLIRQQVRELKQREDQLQLAENRYRVLIENAPFPILITGAQDSRLSYINSLAAARLEIETSQVLQQDLSQFYPQPQEQQAIQAQLQRQGSIQGAEVLLQTASGQKFWASLSANWLSFDNQTMLLWAFTDIDERKQTERQLQLLLKYERALAAFSQTLLTGDSVMAALEHLLNAAEASRIYYVEVFDDPELGPVWRYRYEVCAPGIPSQFERRLACSELSWWQQQHLEGKAVIGLRDSFPLAERRQLELQGIRSILALPLFEQGRYLGYLGFEDIWLERDWSEYERALLQTALEYLQIYFSRQRISSRLNALFDNSVVGIALIAHGRHLQVNQRWCDMLGYTEVELLSCSLMELLHFEDKLRVQESLAQLELRPDQGLRLEVRYLRQNGSLFWGELSASAILDQDQRVEAVVAMVSDIGERKRLEHELRLLATIDPLTKAFNRRHFMQVLEAETSRANRYPTPLSLIMFDIDHFKRINDRFGHDAGDKVLIRVASLVKKRIRNLDIFARTGGEEFFVLLSHTRLEQAIRMAESLCSLLNEEPVEQIGQISASFGVTDYRETESMDQFMKRADTLMYQAKALGRNRVCSEAAVPD